MKIVSQVKPMFIDVRHYKTQFLGFDFILSKIEQICDTCYNDLMVYAKSNIKENKFNNTFLVK